MSGILPLIVSLVVIALLVAAVLYAIFGIPFFVDKMAGASLVGLAPLVPMVAVIVAVLAYVLRVDPISSGDNSAGRFAVLLGSVAALVGWLVFARPYLHFASPSRANERSFQELQYRLEQLYTRLRIAGQSIGANPPLNAEGAALAEAVGHMKYIVEELGYDTNESFLRANPEKIKDLAPGVRWIDATGYLILWERLHRAEEALIEIDGLEEVIALGIHDELRIQGSNIENRDRLLAKVRKAIFVLSNPGAQMPASDYLSEQPPAITKPDASRGTMPVQELEARSVLRQMRRALDEFRDSKWEQLVIARNRLRETVTVTWLVTFLLVAVIILGAVPPDAVMTGAAFFLVGAVVGLFDLLRIANSEKVTLDEDYGFARTQMLQAPLLSGLAAVGGVVLWALVPGIFNSETVQPKTPTPTPTITATAVVTSTITTTLTVSPTTAAIAPTHTPIAGITGTFLSALLLEQTAQLTATPVLTSSTTLTPTVAVSHTATPIPTPTVKPSPSNSLSDIFNIDRNTFGLVIAAIFGLTPGLLTSSLRQKVQGAIGDLNSTEAPDGGSK